ncbi:hypothetical protein CDAR_175181 [Caerostris darwini]|uniref:Uncharacterized protein n=1 Tax=Caerostris darwini TaxID=1538125 RepID=A0AAV4W041_9ARAC|nr:hypothetical protein CDAR_175181 [Caerostris darwini]
MGVGRFEQRKVRRVDVKSELKRDILDDGVEERRDVVGSGDIVGVLHRPGIGMLLDIGLRVGIRARSLNLNKSRRCIPTVRGLSKGAVLLLLLRECRELEQTILVCLLSLQMCVVINAFSK